MAPRSTPAPRCLLLDAPFAHLDVALRHDLAATIRRVSRKTRAAALIATDAADDLAGAGITGLRITRG